MDIVVRLQLMLYSLNITLKEANNSGDIDLVRRAHVARTAVLLSLVEEQGRVISTRLSS